MATAWRGGFGYKLGNEVVFNNASFSHFKATILAHDIHADSNLESLI